MRRQLEADLVGCKAWIRTQERTGREHVLLLREAAASRGLLSARELALRESEDRCVCGAAPYNKAKRVRLPRQANLFLLFWAFSFTWFAIIPHELMSPQPGRQAHCV